jgi:branched-chain amino acid transport system ATP-binding protein
VRVLELREVDAWYGDVQVLRGVSLEVGRGEVLCLMGRNGAGKTTALRAVMGLVPRRAGTVLHRGEPIEGLPAHEVPRRGIGYVPQGRRLFAELTVRENLEVGLLARGRRGALPGVLARFPRLGERLSQAAGTLSGGEQQMLAIGRALCLEPDLLLLDEPTEGLQPSMIEVIRGVVSDLAAEGVAVLLVEQRVAAVLPVASRVAFLEGGRVRRTASVAELEADRALVDRYVGMG